MQIELLCEIVAELREIKKRLPQWVPVIPKED